MRGIIALVTYLVVCVSSMPSMAPFHRVKEAVPDSYIIVLHANADTLKVSAELKFLVQTADLDFGVDRMYKTVLNGFAVSMPPAAVDMVRRHPSVKYMEQDSVVHVMDETWGLDRIDQRGLPLDHTFLPEGNGAGAHVYVIDTGILSTHEEFEERAHFAYDATNNDRGSGTDCNGHGTHCAGTIAGKRYGVAKKANVYGVRVLGCLGSGTNAGVIEGMDWVAQNAQKPAVASMSLGGGATTTTDDAVDRLTDKGITVVVAAGNSNEDACLSSPARASSAITVGASNIKDARASFSNYGGCVDLFAPGRDITSSWNEDDSSYNTISGTSMACPHVAGVAALHVSRDPSQTPREVTASILSEASRDQIFDPMGSPNLLLYTRDR
ncbi:extracellular serine proteinase-like [Anneissia japonica]|uniref:extracellular serine proteinase-like n=1 Tax=Anneissia japonica TaxID=1529436 RepID=UPI0014257D3B|nr:extracellular serine proteinase-like [Anneissia japonica]XP_033102893.1 extracellular serine proteinase-like [Anneissia japonica]